MEQGGNDMDEREELKERFNFTKPVIFQDLEKGFSVTALSDQIIMVLPAIQWVPPDRVGDLRSENRWQF